MSEQELSRLKQLYEWDPWEEDLDTWFYFHPETWDEWIKP